MLTSSLARVFGPIIIGHSRPNPDVELTLKETKKQACVIITFIDHYCDLLFNLLCFTFGCRSWRNCCRFLAIIGVASSWITSSQLG